MKPLEAVAKVANGPIYDIAGGCPRLVLQPDYELNTRQ